MYNLSKEESDRIKIIKLIAIIFVVYIHSYATEANFSNGVNTLYLPIWLQLFENVLSQVISRCGVPIFFLISSILLFKKDRKYVDTIKAKTKTFLTPYIVWNTFWIFVFIILQSMPFTTMYFSGTHKHILQCSWSDWLGLYGVGNQYPQCYPLWFMRDLMVVLLFFPLLKKVVDICPKMMLIVGIGLTIVPVDFFFKKALAWFIIGAVVVKMQIHITDFDKISIKAISCVYLVGIVSSLLLNNVVVKDMFVYIGIIFLIRISKEINSFGCLNGLL